MGPEVIRNGQTEGISPGGAIPNPVIGGVQAVVPVPGEPDQMLLGTVNGGIWRTGDLTNAAGPTWTSVTPNDTFPAAGTVTPLSVGAISFTRNESTQAYAGLALTSAFGQWGTAVGGPPGFGGPTSPIALLRSTDSGDTWSPVKFAAGGSLQGVNISGVQSRGDNVVVVTGRQDSLFNGRTVSAQHGLWRSSDANNATATFANLATGVGDPAHLPVGDYTALVNGPGNMSLMYTAVVNTTDPAQAGVYRSTDAGQTWTQVFTAPAGTNNIKLAGRDGLADPQSVYAAVLTAQPSPDPAVNCAALNCAAVTQVVRFGDSGFGAPTVNVMTPPGDANGGVNPGRQGILHVSIVADPSNPNVVYVGGDRQNLPVVPNAAGASDFSGRLFRGTFTPATPTTPPSTAWAPITNNGTNGGVAPGSSPHADSRAMAFVGSTLYEGDDGGIYRQSNPSNNTGTWSSRIGTGLQITEVYGVAYDRNSKILMSSNQDVGAAQERFVGGTTYDQIPRPAANSFLTGDGGVVLVDNLSQAAMGRSVRYSSSNALFGMQRAVYDAANNPVGAPVALALNEVGGGGTGNLGTEAFAKIPAPFVLNAVDATGQRMVAGTLSQAGRPGAVWESTDGGANFRQVGAGTLAVGENVVSLIAGGRQGGNDFVNVLFAGTSASSIYRRTAAAGGLDALTRYAGGVPWDMVVDREDWSHLFVEDLTNNRIWRSLNADDATAGDVDFSDITDNLLAVAGAAFRAMTIEFLDDMLFVGGVGGVFWTDADAANPMWALAGSGLPNAIVMDLTSDPTTNTLFAGTLGRGIWSINVPEPSSVSFVLIASIVLILRRRSSLSRI